MSFSLNEFLRSGAVMSLTTGKLLLGWGQVQRYKTNTINQDRPAFYFNDFFLSDPFSWIQFSNTLELDREDFYQLLGTIPSPSPNRWIISQPEKFKDSFESLLKLLQTGELKKGVPYTFAKTSNKMSLIQLHRGVMKALEVLKNRAGSLYGWWNENSGILGITPELLFSHSQQSPFTLHTMALAGTCSSKDDHGSFLVNHKERLEHQLVVEGICESFKEWGVASCSTLQILCLQHLSHLMTPIEIQLNQSFEFDTLLRSIHPTPALGAYPKNIGRKWLEEYQKHTPRGFYGAPIGFYQPSQKLTCCYVGIRNVQWDSSGMHIGAGCGVVSSSTFEQEWREIQLKIHAIQDQFNL